MATVVVISPPPVSPDKLSCQRCVVVVVIWQSDQTEREAERKSGKKEAAKPIKLSGRDALNTTTTATVVAAAISKR